MPSLPGVAGLCLPGVPHLPGDAQPSGFVLQLQLVVPKAWGILHVHHMGWRALEQTSDCWYPLVPLASTLGPSRVCTSQTHGTLSPELQGHCHGWLLSRRAPVDGSGTCRAKASGPLSRAMPTPFLQRSSPLAAEPGASEGLGKGLQQDVRHPWLRGQSQPLSSLGTPQQGERLPAQKRQMPPNHELEKPFAWRKLTAMREDKWRCRGLHRPPPSRCALVSRQYQDWLSW